MPQVVCTIRQDDLELYCTRLIVSVEPGLYYVTFLLKRLVHVKNIISPTLKILLFKHRGYPNPNLNLNLVR